MSFSAVGFIGCPSMAMSQKLKGIVYPKITPIFTLTIPFKLFRFCYQPINICSVWRGRRWLYYILRHHITGNITANSSVMDELGHTVKVLSLRQGPKIWVWYYIWRFHRALIVLQWKTGMVIRYITTNETWTQLGRLNLIIFRVPWWALTGQN